MGRRRNFGAILLLGAAAFLMAFVPASAYAKGIDDWLSKSAVSSSYGSLAAEIRSYAAELRQLNLSENLLLMRLEEAANKKVPPALLQSSLRSDMGFIRIAAQSLKSRSLYPTKERDATKSVEKALLLLRAGIGRAELEAAMDASLAKAGPKGKETAVVSRAYSALATAASAGASYKLSEPSRRALAAYLISSDLSEKKFDSALAELARRVQAGESPDTAAASMARGGSEGKNEGKASAPKDKDASGGKPENPGKPDSPGKSDDTGKPEDAGKQDNPGNPGNPGKK